MRYSIKCRDFTIKRKQEADIDQAAADTIDAVLEETKSSLDGLYYYHTRDADFPDSEEVKAVINRLSETIKRRLPDSETQDEIECLVAEHGVAKEKQGFDWGFKYAARIAAAYHEAIKK